MGDERYIPEVYDTNLFEKTFLQLQMMQFNRIVMNKIWKRLIVSFSELKVMTSTEMVQTNANKTGYLNYCIKKWILDISIFQTKEHSFFPKVFF